DLYGIGQSVEPGEHELSVEAGGQSQTLKLVVNAGEKNRRVEFVLRTPAPMAPVPPPPPPAPTIPTALTLAAGAGLVVFGALGITGRVLQNQLLSDACAATKTCDPARETAIRGL